MDTQETGTTGEQSSEASTEETTFSDTSTEGEVDADYIRAKDKKAYLANLDREIKEKEALRKKVKSEPESDDDVMTWLTINSDGLKLTTKEYNEELAFYKSHKIPITNEIRDRALRDAKTRKGVRITETTDRTAVTTEVQGETRKAPKPDEIPSSVMKMSKTMTPEKFAQYREEFKARGLKV